MILFKAIRHGKYKIHSLGEVPIFFRMKCSSIPCTICGYRVKRKLLLNFFARNLVLILIVFKDNKLLITMLFNNMWTLKFRSRLTNALVGGFSQLTTTAEHCFVVWTVHSDLITTRSAVVGGWEELPNIWLTVAKNTFVGWALNFRVRMLLKGAVRNDFHNFL